VREEKNTMNIVTRPTPTGTPFMLKFGLNVKVIAGTWNSMSEQLGGTSVTTAGSAVVQRAPGAGIGLRMPRRVMVTQVSINPEANTLAAQPLKVNLVKNGVDDATLAASVPFGSTADVELQGFPGTPFNAGDLLGIRESIAMADTGTVTGEVTVMGVYL
jgi:hypothetical protein